MKERRPVRSWCVTSLAKAAVVVVFVRYLQVVVVLVVVTAAAAVVVCRRHRCGSKTPLSFSLGST